jgi:hypothetical protein
MGDHRRMILNLFAERVRQSCEAADREHGMVHRGNRRPIELGMNGTSSYAVLRYTSALEQAQSPGTKSLGVAVLGMILGIPMLLFSVGSALSFTVAVGAVVYRRLHPDFKLTRYRFSL